MEPLSQLIAADARLTALVERLSPAGLSAATPCSEWDVRSMLSHTLQSIEAFSSAVDGGPGPDEAALFSGHDILGSDPLGTTKRITQRSQAAWSSRSDWEAPVATVLGPIPAGQAIAIITFSTLMHSWDLAVAMGETVEFTADEAALAEAVGNQLVPMMRPKGLYGPEVPAPADATPTQRLVAFSGRTPI